MNVRAERQACLDSLANQLLLRLPSLAQESRPFTVVTRIRRILGRNMTLAGAIESVACHIGRAVRQAFVVLQFADIKRALSKPS